MARMSLEGLAADIYRADPNDPDWQELISAANQAERAIQRIEEIARRHGSAYQQKALGLFRERAEGVVAQVRAVEEKRAALEAEIPTDSIYIVHRPDTNEVKIGTSTNVSSRLTALQGASGARLVLLATMPGGRVEERALHERFAAHRKAGEWFALSPEIRAWLSEVAS